MPSPSAYPIILIIAATPGSWETFINMSFTMKKDSHYGSLFNILNTPLDIGLDRLDSRLYE